MQFEVWIALQKPKLFLASAWTPLSFSFQSPVWVCTLGNIHTTHRKFENTVSFLWLGLPSTLIRHENGAFRKYSANRENLKTPALGSILESEVFDNDGVTIIM